MLRRHPSIYLAFLSVCCGLLYLGGQAVWDDHGLLLSLAHTPILDIIASPVGLGEIGNSYYRPLSMLLLKAAAEPVYIHFLIIAIHTTTTLFLYQITARNWLITLLFGIHPLCSEILGWSSALPDALSTFFSAILFWSLQEKRVSWVIPCAFLALCSKENAILMIAGVCLFYPERKRLIMAVLLYFLLRFTVIGPTEAPEFLGRTALGLKGVLWLWASSVYPFPLTAVRDIWQVSPLALSVGFVPALVALHRYRNGSRNEKIGALLWLLAPLIALPTIASSHLAAERYMYLGVFGMSVSLSSFRLEGRKCLMLGGLWIVVSIPLHIQRATAWKNDINLFTAAVNTFPSSSYSHHLLGFSYLHAKEYAQAARSFENGLHLEHAYPTERLLLIQSLVLDGNYSKALTIADQGPKDNLTAEYLAWWGRAAYEAGQIELAWRIWSPLLRKEAENSVSVLDGPAWFPSYVLQRR